MSTHARLNCSGAVRWENCAGSIREEAVYPDISGAAAIDGTGSHYLLELCLTTGRTAQSFLNEAISDPEYPLQQWRVNQDRIDRVQMAIDYIIRRFAELQADYPHSTVTLEAESRCDPGALVGRADWWGTADITITCTAPDGSINHLEICDYKDGRSFVDPNDNPQLLSYLSGKIPVGVYVGECRMSIVQPKTHPPIRYQDLTPDVVMQHHARMAAAAAETDDPHAPLNRGSWCKWCKHKPKCEEHKAMDLELLNADVLTMSDDDLVKLLNMRERIENTVNMAKVEAITRLEKGVPLTGYVMVAGKKTKKWNMVDEEIVKILKSRKFKLNDIFPPKLITPAVCLSSELLTDVQKDTLAKKFIKTTTGKPVLKVVEVISFI